MKFKGDITVHTNGHVVFCPENQRLTQLWLPAADFLVLASRKATLEVHEPEPAKTAGQVAKAAYVALGNETDDAEKWEKVAYSLLAWNADRKR